MDLSRPKVSAADISAMDFAEFAAFRRRLGEFEWEYTYEECRENFVKTGDFTWLNRMLEKI